MSIAPKGQDIRFSEERIEQGRNFCNKLWNVSRFRQMADEKTVESTEADIISRIQPDQLNQDDHAILLRLVQTLDEVERLYEDYEFNSVLQAIYRFSGMICATGMWKTQKRECVREVIVEPAWLYRTCAYAKCSSYSIQLRHLLRRSYGKCWDFPEDSPSNGSTQGMDRCCSIISKLQESPLIHTPWKRCWPYVNWSPRCGPSRQTGTLQTTIKWSFRI